MAGGTFDALLRIRRLAVDAAARELGAAIRAGDQARQARAALTEAMAREQAVGRAMAASDPALVPFAAWQARARRGLEEAAARERQAEDAITAAREALGAARGAARAIELAIARRTAAAAQAAAHAAQLELEDVAQSARARDS